jgi:hypothetical protein
MAAGLLVAMPADASIQLDGNQLIGRAIQFSDGGDGVGGADDTFSFTPPGGPHFTIFDVTGGTGAAFGLVGSIFGTFVMDAISPPIPVGPGVVIESSTVTTTGGSLVIPDGGGFNFTADLDITEISTINNFGQIQTTGNANLSNLSYGGANADLAELASHPEGLLQVDFLASAGEMLSSLTDNNRAVESFGVLISSEGEPGGNTGVIPEPASVLVWSVLGLVIGTVVYRRRRMQGR